MTPSSMCLLGLHSVAKVEQMRWQMHDKHMASKQCQPAANPQWGTNPWPGTNPLS